MTKTSKVTILIISAVLIIGCIVCVAIMLNERSSDNKPLTVTELLHLGDKYLLELDYEQALVQFLKVIEIEPRNPHGYLEAAEAYIGLGDIDKAIEILESGLEATGDERIKARLEELTVPPETESSAIENNGGIFVSRGDDVYFREYTDANYEDIALYGMFGAIENEDSKLNRLKPDGSIETLFEIDGADENIFILNDRFYLQRENGLYSIDMNGENQKYLGKKNIVQIDAERELIVLEYDTNISIYSAHNDEEYIIAKDRTHFGFVKYDVKSGIVFYDAFNDSISYEMAQNGQLELRTVHYDGTDNRTLAITEPNLYDNDGHSPYMYSPARIWSLHLLNDYVYFSYGSTGGSGNYFQGGNISRVRLDGSGYEVLSYVEFDESTPSSGEINLIVENNRVYFVSKKNYDSEKAYLTSFEGDFSVDNYTEIPFIDSEHNISLFNPNDNSISVLVTLDELVTLGYERPTYAYSDNPYNSLSTYSTLTFFEYVNGKVFFQN